MIRLCGWWADVPALFWLLAQKLIQVGKAEGRNELLALTGQSWHHIFSVFGTAELL